MRAPSKRFPFTLHKTPSNLFPLDPVNEDVLSENRKMITNRQLELYNEAAVDVLNSSNGNGRSRVKLLAASRQAALETITQSDDGLHLPESTRNVVGSISVKLRLFLYSVIQVKLLWQHSAQHFSFKCYSLSGSHGPHELCVQQATEAH